MKVSLQVPSFKWPGGPGAIRSTLGEIGRAADEAGFDSIFVMDHVFQVPEIGEADDPLLEAYGALHYLAGLTERVRLGAMTTAVSYRNPGMLVKSVTTLDVLSGGRAWLGIGAGYYEREATGLGLPLPPVQERFEQLEETLRIVHQMWAGDRTPIRGKHFQLAEPINSPQPLTSPHPPILIGGGGERKTLRYVAEYGDACNFSLFNYPDFADLSRKLDVLQSYCADVGRPFDEIDRTVLSVANLADQSPDDIIDHCRQLADLGFTHVNFVVPGDYQIDPLIRMGREVIPAVTVF